MHLQLKEAVWCCMQHLAACTGALPAAHLMRCSRSCAAGCGLPAAQVECSRTASLQLCCSICFPGNVLSCLSGMLGMLHLCQCCSTCNAACHRLQITDEKVVFWAPSNKMVAGRQRQCIGAIIFSESPLTLSDDDAVPALIQVRQRSPHMCGLWWWCLDISGMVAHTVRMLMMQRDCSNMTLPREAVLVSMHSILRSPDSAQDSTRRARQWSSARA